MATGAILSFMSLNNRDLSSRKGQWTSKMRATCFVHARAHHMRGLKCILLILTHHCFDGNENRDDRERLERCKVISQQKLSR